MDFSQALMLAKDGNYICRRGWNGKGMYIRIANPDPKDEERTSLPYLQLLTARGQWIPWTVSQADVLAEDWEWSDTQPDTLVPLRRDLVEQ